MREDERDFFAIQSLIWPDPAISTNTAIWLRLDAGAALTADFRHINFADGGSVRFDSAFNVFPLRKWQAECGLEDLWLALRGRGRFEVSVTVVKFAQAEPRVILAQVVDLVPDAPLRLDLSDRIVADEDGILFLGLRAQGEGLLPDAVW